jgi:hypothetical protein
MLRRHRSKSQHSFISPIVLYSFFFKFVRWDFGYCGHYWPIVPAPNDR